ncbi:MAG: 4Fe-4S binding protein [Paracoccus sp. (in: a-proteobacteria)]|uniref:NosR/NirI family protein n=1 Tax=Paracoccus sp. TaxID=267 RepID=UPI0026E011D1|nr:NosR/NirI family protein [Paracoccus sp. (in: a-proteobacteria)]MDO5614420.1 4Fe-4S binding protein [Paracoccus sp. (in: a-proteobacteria)]
MGNHFKTIRCGGASGRGIWLFLAWALSVLAWVPAAWAAPPVVAADSTPTITQLDSATAQALFGLAAPPQVTRQQVPVPSFRVEQDGMPVGIIGSTWELVSSTGYSGQPLDVLVAVRPDGVIAGARLMRHAEPVLTLGISDDDIAAYVDRYAGLDLNAPVAGQALPDVISRATVSTAVIRDGILRAGRILAAAQAGGDLVNRVAYQPADWAALLDMGALSQATVSMAEAAAAFDDARNPLTPSDAPFIDLYAGIIDPPTVGRNLLVPRDYSAALGDQQPGQVWLAVLSHGAYGHRGTEVRRSGVFQRLTISQGDLHWQPDEANFRRIDRLAIEGAPTFPEMSLFRLNADPADGGFDLTQPLHLSLAASRDARSGTPQVMQIDTEVTLPPAFRNQTADTATEPPLWVAQWETRIPQLAVVGAMLAVLGVILFAQEWLVRRPLLWRRVRTGFLLTTLLVLGWGLNGQLSVVQVVAFLHSLLGGFRWETFLVAPVIFVLWCCVALGMLFWGRGVFCGWLCPFGALQELTNQAAQRFGIRQITVPQALHERLWVIKYTLFVAIVALSFYSMEQALILAEVEPFKTAISMRFMRAWPFVLFVVALLAAGLFIERFFCRYLCPLGAGLAIPAKLKVFDWLKRRPQCGRECRLCETKCTVGAIDPLGRINANECVLCLRCQVIMNDDKTCPVL